MELRHFDDGNPPRGKTASEQWESWARSYARRASAAGATSSSRAREGAAYETKFNRAAKMAEGAVQDAQEPINDRSVT